MFILYMHHSHHEYYHGTFYRGDWGNYPYFRAGEGYWLVPGTDPEDPAYDQGEL